MKTFRNFTSVCLLFTIMGCGSTIALFDQYAYAQTISIKVDALHLMDSATEDYNLHKQEVQSVNIAIEKMIEYKKHQPKDTVNTHMWLLMNDSTGLLYGSFINRWKQKGRLHPAAVKDARKLISFNFDRIAELESKKVRSSQVSN